MLGKVAWRKMVAGKQKQTTGQGLVEFMIAFPLVLLALAGTIQLTWILLTQSLLHSSTSHIADYAAVHPESKVELMQIFWHRMKPVPNHGLAIPDIKILVDEDTMDGSFWVRNDSGSLTLPSDVVHLRMAELDANEQELYLRARTPQLRVSWCFPMRVPIVNFIIGSVSKGECTLEGVSSTPHILLESQTRFTMESDWTVSKS